MAEHFRDPDLWQKILEKTEDGEHLRGICREFGIGKSAFYDWKNSTPELAKEYEQARLEGAHTIAQRLRATARGKTEAEGGDSTGDVQRDKLICDVDLKLLAKWHSQYSDKVALVGGGEGDAPIRVSRIELVPGTKG